MEQPTYLREEEDINGTQAASVNVQIQMSNHQNNAPVSASRSWLSGVPASVQRGSLPSRFPGHVEGNLEGFADIMAVQHAYLCALHDPDQIIPMTLLQQSPQALKNHYARDSNPFMPHSWESAVNAAFPCQAQKISESSQMKHLIWNNISHSSTVQERIRVIRLKGEIASLLANPQGSRLIQKALETATSEEILMMYEEVIPCAQQLTIDVFANSVVEKLLDHGPQDCQRELINNLIGHVLPLSLHTYGCRVIQKAFEVADQDQKVQMANEFYGEVQKCAGDQYASPVLQKCIECVHPQHIQFIFWSFCGKVKAFSTSPYGCHVVQKVLTFCDNPQLYRALVSEIAEAIAALAEDPFGIYVVQHVVELGGPVERSMIMSKLQGRVLSMSYHKYASVVIQQCLTFGGIQDIQLIAEEILSAGTSDSQHFDHLVDMMCHPFANYVIQRLVTMADEGQLHLLAEVARRNMATIMRCQNGRLVIAQIQNVVAERDMPSNIEPQPADLSGC